MNNYKTINSFNNIKIVENSLIICDIDETLLHFKNWDSNFWINNYNHYLKIYNDKEKAKNKTDIEYEKYIYSIKPTHNDKNGFFEMTNKIKKSNSKLIFVTARDLEAKNFTHNNLKKLKVNYKKYPVFFSALTPKGEFIKHNFNLSSFNKIIFIDDLEYNINSVTNEFGNMIRCYKYIMN